MFPSHISDSLRGVEVRAITSGHSSWLAEELVEPRLRNSELVGHSHGINHASACRLAYTCKPAYARPNIVTLGPPCILEILVRHASAWDHQDKIRFSKTRLRLPNAAFARTHAYAKRAIGNRARITSYVWYDTGYHWLLYTGCSKNLEKEKIEETDMTSWSMHPHRGPHEGSTCVAPGLVTWIL